MADSERGNGDDAETDDELRTIGFRLREIQRLLSARVEQENRRLEAEGLEPVSESRFDAGEPSADESPEPSE